MSGTSPSLKDFESSTISWWFRNCAARSKVFHDSSSLGLTKSLLSSVHWMIHFFLQNRLTAAFDSLASSTLLLDEDPICIRRIFFQRLSCNATATEMQLRQGWGWQSFESTCDVFNCLFPLDVQNEIQLLSRVFSYSWLVCLLGFSLRNASLVKADNYAVNGFQEITGPSVHG